VTRAICDETMARMGEVAVRAQEDALTPIENAPGSPTVNARRIASPRASRWHPPSALDDASEVVLKLPTAGTAS
jgi:hypothetical protein